MKQFTHCHASELFGRAESPKSRQSFVAFVDHNSAVQMIHLLSFGECEGERLLQLAAPDSLSTLPDVGSIALLVAPAFLLGTFQVCQHSVDHRREPGQLVVALGHNSCRKIAARSDGSDILPQPNQSREHLPFQQEQRNHTEYNPDHQRRNH